MTAEAVVQVAAMVPTSLAEQVRSLADRAERSTAAEIRLALKAWVDAARLEDESKASA